MIKNKKSATVFFGNLGSGNEAIYPGDSLGFLRNNLSSIVWVPTGKYDQVKVGVVPHPGAENDSYHLDFGGSIVLRFCIEQKNPPESYITSELNRFCKKRRSEGGSLSRRDRVELRRSIEMELLPNTIPSYRYIDCFISIKSNHLFIVPFISNTYLSGLIKDKLLHIFFESFGDISIVPWHFYSSLSFVSGSDGVSIDLVGLSGEHKVLRYPVHSIEKEGRGDRVRLLTDYGGCTLSSLGVFTRIDFGSYHLDSIPSFADSLFRVIQSLGLNLDK